MSSGMSGLAAFDVDPDACGDRLRRRIARVCHLDARLWIGSRRWRDVAMKASHPLRLRREPQLVIERAAIGDEGAPGRQLIDALPKLHNRNVVGSSSCGDRSSTSSTPRKRRSGLTPGESASPM